MSYTGTVEHGVVKLPPEAALPDGTKVRIEPLRRKEAPKARLVKVGGRLFAAGARVTNEDTQKVMAEFP